MTYRELKVIMLEYRWGLLNKHDMMLAIGLWQLQDIEFIPMYPPRHKYDTTFIVKGV